MRFIRPLTLPLSTERLLWAPFLSVLLMLIFVLFCFSFTTPDKTQVKFPKAVTSDILHDDKLIISISAEQVIYFNNRVVTMKELRQSLAQSVPEPRNVLIKADRHAALGRLVDIWNLCRELGIADINLATSREK